MRKREVIGLIVGKNAQGCMEYIHALNEMLCDYLEMSEPF